MNQFFVLIAYQWVDTLIQFNNKNQWIGKSLARSIARYLFNKTNNPIEKFMSTVIIDSLCNTESGKQTNNIIFEDILIKKGEAFLTAYRLSIGDNEFQSQIPQLIFNESILFTNSSLIGSHFLNHQIISLNSSTNDIHLFKLNLNCSLPSFPLTLHNSSFISNPFFHIFYSSWDHFINDIKFFQQQINSFSKVLFDGFLFNLSNQLSIKYPLELINLFCHQS
ncbi:unnamed protein product [Adineta steineri]|uniref:Uncharacterized protein n=1 Tax=Adineta steineri TaxID=433720 RepID=A0A818SCI6_9BILA|nr:unnamed protein product [Adineta steineri]